MADTLPGISGIERLVEKWRGEFRRPENTNYYSVFDYKEAERKFVKLCLNGRFNHGAHTID